MKAIFQRKEEGSNSGLVYAMCFVAFVTCLYLFVMMEYRAKIHMLKDEMETKLHIVENYCLTLNNDDFYSSDYERERDRAHIVTISADEDRSGAEAQAINVATAFSERFREEFGLNGSKPNGGVLAQMTNNGDYNQMAKLHIKSLTIYEPKYTPGTILVLYCGNDSHEHTLDCSEPEKCDLPENFPSGMTPEEAKRWTSDGTVDGYRVPTGFFVATEPESWWVYEFEFDDNNTTITFFNSYEYMPTDPGRPDPPVVGSVFGETYDAEGATIQATIRAEFARPFGFWGENMNLGGLESVEVTEGIDIVFSSYDSRQK